MVSKRLVAIATLVIATIGTASALVLFVQNFPSVAITTPVLQSQCVNLNEHGALVSGVAGYLIFGCDSGPTLRVVAVGTATPTFSLPTDVLEIRLATNFAADASNCNTGFDALTSGTPVPFNNLAAAFWYCVKYTATTGSTTSGFSLAWNQ